VHRSRLPGADDATPLVVVSRSGTTVDTPTVIDPEELVETFRSGRAGAW
jgi:hypothetical protein